MNSREKDIKTNYLIQTVGPWMKECFEMMQSTQRR